MRRDAGNIPRPSVGGRPDDVEIVALDTAAHVPHDTSPFWATMSEKIEEAFISSADLRWRFVRVGETRFESAFSPPYGTVLVMHAWIKGLALSGFPGVFWVTLELGLPLSTMDGDAWQVLLKEGKFTGVKVDRKIRTVGMHLAP